MSKLKIKTGFLTLLIFSGLFYSCKKHKAKDPDPGSVTINIISPTAAQEFDKGDTIFIKATISAPWEMHGYEVHVTRLADTTEILNRDIDLHAKSFEVSEYFINDGAMHTEMELEITAFTDHNGNQTSKKVEFHCHEQ